MIGKSSFMYKFGACTFSESDLLSLNGVLRKNLLIDAQMRARKVILRSQRSTGMYAHGNELGRGALRQQVISLFKHLH